MDVEALLADERGRWDQLWSAFEQVPDDRFEEPSLTTEGWSPKDLLFHMAAWLDECTAVLERELSGAPPPDGGEDTDAKNARFLKASQAMTAEEVRGTIEPARERMIASFTALEEITSESWEWFEESGPIHYAEHGRELRGWLEGGP